MASSSSDSEFENQSAAGGESSKMVFNVEAVHLALTSDKSDPVSDSIEDAQCGSRSGSPSTCDSPTPPAPLTQSYEVS